MVHVGAHAPRCLLHGVLCKPHTRLCLHTACAGVLMKDFSANHVKC